jgi:hypothetical protein
MPKIAICRFDDCVSELSAETIRSEIVRFTELLRKVSIQTVRVWCSWNPDLPEDSPLQSPDETIPPHLILDFFDAAVRNGIWIYGDGFCRAGIDAVDGSFHFLIGNDKDISLDTEKHNLLDAIREAWVSAGYEVYGIIGTEWLRINPPSAPDSPV